MKNKYLFAAVMLCAILIVGMGLTTLYVNSSQETQTDHTLTVVTSFYPMYIAADNIIDGADGVRLENLSEPQTGCLHDFQLTPEDMKLLSTADVFIINGGGIETFMKKVAAAYPDLTVIEACEQTELLPETDGDSHDHDHENEDEDHEDNEDNEDVNAHAWMSIPAYETQVNAIAQGLSAADPSRSSLYTQNEKTYRDKLETLRKRQDKLKEKLKGEPVILFHEAYAYVAEDYGLDVKYLLNLDEERQISAGEVSDVISAVKNDHTNYILAEKLYGKSMGDTIEKETGVTVLYLDPLNRGDYDKDSYIDGMTKNMDLLEEAFYAKNH